ncbi:hypothetical protein [Virgibacillus sediminis]|uniref:Phr family secreted Rap phosphatase inhibitor n=1 Tax=Virgibacillus sediminis TaxID=202260 RepID=A0ABV7A1Y6_9BACI
MKKTSVIGILLVASGIIIGFVMNGPNSADGVGNENVEIYSEESIAEQETGCI